MIISLRFRQDRLRRRTETDHHNRFVGVEAVAGEDDVLIGCRVIRRSRY
ncbi:MAG: hypothetical protein WAM97_06950 [Acidimicrobiales bacterium]